MLILDKLHITPEILTLIAEIDEFKGAWRALGTLAPERLKPLCRVAEAGRRGGGGHRALVAHFVLTGSVIEN